ncbi:hypothetical protein CWRG_01155 [Chthonomonas calidirosea]|nr:hypothetical protein CWRG_01155 [Chthonomonas calidirosea]
MAKANQPLPKQRSMSVPQAAVVAMRRHLAEVMQHVSALHQLEAVHELHDLRIAIKHLRYTLELFLEAPEMETVLYPSEKTALEALLVDLRCLQELLGNIHDADVLMPTLLKQLGRMAHKGYGKDAHGMPIIGVHHVDLEGCEGLVALCCRIKEQRAQHYAELRRVWERPDRQQLLSDLAKLLARLDTELAPVQEG